MLKKSPPQNQLNCLEPILLQLIDTEKPLVKLADQIPWNEFEQAFQKHYANNGKPSQPIRKMVGLLILKQLKNLSDETVCEQWEENMYYQYFSGENTFQKAPPCHPTDLVYFRKRIGEQGIKKIFEISAKMHKKNHTKTIIVDTTAQPKDITYPTDSKQYKKIALQCVKIAQKEGITLRQTYTRTLDKLMNIIRYGHHAKKKKKANNAQRKLKTIAARLLRDLQKKLSVSLQAPYEDFFSTAAKILLQTRTSKNKIYSLHEPDTCCIAKGKSGVPYEYGSKVSLGISENAKAILSVSSYASNLGDVKTLQATLENYEDLVGQPAKIVIGDRGYKGPKKIGDTKVVTPYAGKTLSTDYSRRKFKSQMRRRSSIEAVISSLKRQYGLARNYLSGIVGDRINAFLSSAAFNFSSLLQEFSSA